MNRDQTDVKEEQFVEDVGIYYEQLGMPRMAGRMMARLLICDPPHQSMQDLAHYLQASKGSISTSSRMLIQAGIMERIRFPRDRNDYYRIKENVWSRMFKTQLDRTIEFKEFIRKGLDILKRAPDTKKDRLTEMLAFYKWLETEMPRMMDRWEKHRKRTSASLR